MSRLIDDRDPSVIYSSGWYHGGVPAEYNVTTTYADDPGLTATLAFQGSQIRVFGTIAASNDRTGPRSSYTLDNTTPVFYQGVPTAVVQYSVQFYISPLLPYGPHTLVVTHINTTDSLFLDYFQITGSVDTSSSLTITPSSPIVTQSSIGLFPTSTPPSASTLQEKPSSNNTGIIAGCAIGAAILIALIVIVILLLRRRNSRRLTNTNPSTYAAVPSGSGLKPHQLEDPYRPSSSAPPPYNS